LKLRIANIDPQGAVALALLGEAAAEVRPLYSGAAAPSDSAPGNGALRQPDSGTGEIRRLYVHRDYRRGQVGRALRRTW
jgi:hypothetical protein